MELSGNDADVLELMAAASFFQLEGLLRYTEARCAEIIDIDNVVAMYIHAKVRRNKCAKITMASQPISIFDLGVQCIKVDGILPGVSVTEHGRFVDVR